MNIPSGLQTEMQKRNISKDILTKQIFSFIKGSYSFELSRAATVNDGIVKLKKHDQNKYITLYNKHQKDLKIYKFTPASGMATRMFKNLIEFYHTKVTNTGAKYFFNNLYKFPFYKDVIIEFHKEHPTIKKLDTLKNKLIFLDFLLNEEHLNYKSTPKGLIKFHQYDIDNKTPLEEQIDESIHYTSGKDDKINIHFTVNPKYIEEFKTSSLKYINDNYADNKALFQIDFSTQKSTTDTIAVNMDNTPYICSKGNYLFRAGGHGALIENLNDIDSDIIFIKNIDNVCHQSHIEETIKYKQILAGKLIATQKNVFKYLEQLEKNKADSDEIIDFIKDSFHIALDKNTNSTALFDFLNRPIRVCGMILNQGDAGGGPFWIKDGNGKTSLQIIEAAQVNQKDKKQVDTLLNATHFNPVDLVCAVKNYKGEKFDLTQYVDHNAYFITEKGVDGKTIKALELPGLWNGAMADWLSIFVEVPLDTFSPVKSVTDLLSPMHQA